MELASEEIYAVLRQYNPWWTGGQPSSLSDWHRAAFHELDQWVMRPPARRAIMLSGPRQVGKTTLLLQCIQRLLKKGVPPQNILYVTFDHPLFKLMGVERVLQMWRDVEVRVAGDEYVFIDEVQFLREWQTWLKLQVDFQKDRRLIVTGSATPLLTEGQESGVGRWHTIRLPTLSFYEYLKIKDVALPSVPEVSSLARLFAWSKRDFASVSDSARPLAAQFHEYLLRGGFPQCALTDSIELAQRLLREDIVDKVLKRDMTALFGVRRILELEQTFLYLCLHDGGLLDITTLSKNLAVKKQTAANFISLLENTHLIYRLSPFGYGKEVLRGQHKVYLADAAIGPSVLLKGKSLLEDDTALGRAVETAFFKHVFTRYYSVGIGFSYWRGRKNEEVDIVAQVGGRTIPFEVKYRMQKTGLDELKGIVKFCNEKQIDQGYVITREMTDFGVLPFGSRQLLKIPAALACFWLGQSEVLGTKQIEADLES